MELYRCDWCWELIDPVDGDERNKMYIEVVPEEGESSKQKVDLCSDCSPESAGAHLDWVDYNKDD